MEMPSKYNPKDVEPKILQTWLATNDFAARTDPKQKPYSIVIPPPNITGILHMGHALNNTIQDVLIRFKRMQKYQALWMPGTDHAGIATQNVVEKDLAKQGIKKEDIGREEFIKKLMSWRDEYGSTIISQLKKLGASCDWQRTRFTMDEGYSQAVKEVFVRLYEKGLIYRGNYIINWCPRCKTALSDEEAARKEIDGWLYYIRYPVIPEPETHNPEPRYIVVATTRPETMLGDTAVAINPKDKRYKWLKSRTVILPIVEKELKVIEDEAIDPEFGTGVVKVTPAHDPADFILGKKYDLDFINVMNEDATINSNAPNNFIGCDRFEARASLLRILEEKGLIEKKEPYKISAGHCYRCQTIIEPRLSLQWFVKMKPLAKAAIKVVEKDQVKFYPQRWKKVYLNWMHNIQDWCISRQIWWGHRLPVFYCKSCKRVIVSKTTPKQCPDCKGSDLQQDPDVLDTWFSSWLWPFATFTWPKKDKDLDYFYPTVCLVTASEILFFWVARMIMAGLEFMNDIPFRDVIIHGTVRDARGIKMSKSLGNIIDPLQIIDKFGADALRFSLMLLAASGSDVYLSDEKFLVGRNFSNKIWNATRFLLLKIKENNLKLENLTIEDTGLIEKWVLTELNGAIEKVSQNLDSYLLNDAAKKVYDFFWHVFCDWYIEIIKEDFDANKAKVAMLTLTNTLKLLHPFMPFITEEIHLLINSGNQISSQNSLVNSSWPQKIKFKTKKGELLKISALFNTIREIRNIKNDLGLGQKKIGLTVKTKPQYQKIWEDGRLWIQRLTSTNNIVFKARLERTLYEDDFWELNFDIEPVDSSAFAKSMAKKCENLERVLSKVNAKLDNKNFIEKAAPDIVDKEKIRSKDMTTQLARFNRLRAVFK